MRRRPTAALVCTALALSLLALPQLTDATIIWPGAWHPHVRAAKRYAERRAGTVHFAVKGLDGRMRGFHVGATAPMASTFKVLLLLTYLRQHSVRHRALKDSERALLGPMIRVSDSVAATRVRDIVGVDAIERLAHDAHLRDFTYNAVWGLSRDSSRDQVRLMYHLERYIPKRHRHYAMRLLRTITPSQRWGVGRLDLGHWKLFFKGGWGSGSGAVDHQVALIKARGERVSLAILTENDGTHDYGKETLEGVAKRLLHGLSHVP
jgi:Beta-lactamase enzyme family